MPSYYSGPTLTREQTAQVAYQAGARGEDLVFLTAVPERESAYIAGAHRTDSPRERLSGDRGLWQINYIWDEQLRQAGIINSPQDLFDPLVNARAALFVLQRQGRNAWMAYNGSQGMGVGHGLNMSAASAAVSSAQSQGMLGQDWNSGQSGAPGASAPGATAAASGAPARLPKDTRLIRVDGGRIAAIYKISPGVSIHYFLNGSFSTAGFPIQNMTRAQFEKTYGRSVDGGDAAELAEIPTAFGTYAGYTNAILDQIFPKGDPRRNDPEIMLILAQRAGRPDMTEAEFENLLKGTKYYQSRTEGQLRWNDISEAERNTQRRDMEARMMQTVLSMVGMQASREGGTSGGFIFNNTIKAYIEKLASGAMGFGEWTETVLKPFAQRMPESPWSRQLRDEQENQRQRPIDIENTALRIRDTLAQWGLNWSEKSIQAWARSLTENRQSDDDLLEKIKDQAQVLYSWKDREMETMVAAAPWIETYNRVLERQGTLRTPEIARVLAAYGRDPDNNDVWSFEQKLKMTDDYDQTRGGEDEAWSQVGELAGALGF